MASSAPPLDKVDPAQAWQPWKPDARDPWGIKWAGHLYRRAAFGATLPELRAAVRRGLPATLDLLLKGEPGAESLTDTLNTAGQYAAKRDNVNDLRGWWLYCMLQGRHPLREKMTLFWHNHFATSVAKVGSNLLMFKQNELIRRHALGKFGPFVQAMSKDPAMLVWLDSNRNIKGRANENYARELMELFTLGVGNYTEKDIREAARAFTGWHTEDDAYEFKPRFHDDGAKTVLGQTGKWNGDDVVRICLKQPVAARFIVRKLYHFLVSEAQEPTDALLEPLADGFRKSDYDIAALVRTILASRHFYSAHAYRQRIKSPVEYVLGAVRVVVDGPLPQGVLVRQLEQMGQLLFAPPNVKGWPGGQAWLNTSTLLARQNFAQALAMGTLWRGSPQMGTPPFATVPKPPSGGKPKTAPGRPEEPPPQTKFDPARVIHTEKMTNPGDVVGVLLDAYLPGGIAPSARTQLVKFVGKGNPKGPALDRRVREAVHAILSMPESQLA